MYLGYTTYSDNNVFLYLMTTQSVVTLLHSHALFLVRMGVQYT